MDEVPCSVYIGQWKANKPHGYGQQVWTEYWSPSQNLNEYQSTLEDNPKRPLLQTTSYEGEYSNGLKHGQGTFTFADGSTYTGEFRQNCITGFGKYEYNSTSENNYYCINYLGEFSNGEFHGQGRLEKSIGNGVRILYEGGFNYGKRHGYGSLDDQKTLYRGAWKNGLKHGIGEVILKSSDQKGYSGYWSEGEYVKEIA